MRALMPRLGRMMGDFKVNGPVKIRPADLCITHNYQQAGIVLVGDAFSTSCPAAGTGTTKVFTDVGRLCNAYIPQWLATEGMDTRKIAQFYADPEKQACETRSLEKAYHLRSLSTANGLSWRAQRWARFLARLTLGIRQSVRKGFSEAPADTRRDAAGSGQPRHGRLA